MKISKMKYFKKLIKINFRSLRLGHLPILKIVSVFLVTIFVYFIGRAVFPVLPKPLNKKIEICQKGTISTWKGEWTQVVATRSKNMNPGELFEVIYEDAPTDGLMFWCEASISHQVLLKANTINVVVETNQKVNIQLSFYRKSGGGPTWENISAAPNRVVSISHPLDRPKDRKINWLVGEFGQMAFLVTGYNYEKPVRIKIHETYLR